MSRRDFHITELSDIELERAEAAAALLDAQDEFQLIATQKPNEVAKNVNQGSQTITSEPLIIGRVDYFSDGSSRRIGKTS